jgi:hypothetical protein
MKQLLIAIALFVSTSVFAKNNFDIDIIKDKDGNHSIIYNTDDWKLITKTANYDVYVPTELLRDKGKTVHTFHGMTVFHKEQTYSYIPGGVKKMYSYGILNCDTAELYLMGDFYASSKEVVLFHQTHDWGTYITNMNVPNTSRNEVYNAVCKDSI